MLILHLFGWLIAGWKCKILHTLLLLFLILLWSISNSGRVSMFEGSKLYALSSQSYCIRACIRVHEE